MMRAIVRTYTKEEKEAIRKKGLEWIENHFEAYDEEVGECLRKSIEFYQKPQINPNGVVIEGCHRLHVKKDCDFDIIECSDEEALRRRIESIFVHKSDEVRKQQLEKHLMEAWKKYEKQWEADNSIIEVWRGELRIDDRAKLSRDDIIHKKMANDYHITLRRLNRYLPEEFKRPHKVKKSKTTNKGVLDPQKPQETPVEIPKDPKKESREDNIPSPDYKIECPHCGTLFNRETRQPLTIKDNNIPKAKSEPEKCCCFSPIPDDNHRCQLCGLPL